MPIHSHSPSKGNLLNIKELVLLSLRSQPTGLFLAVFCGVICYQYFQTKIYKFPDPTPFQGAYLYNPYENLNGQWVKANFHAHSKSWFGLTNGHQSGEELVNTYQKFGYDVASISDYHKINNSIYKEDNISIPVYEHGMNLSKVHQLAIGASEVTFFDVMLWQNNSIRQSILNRIKNHAPIVCINHPAMRKGYPIETISKLSGYECLEVLNSSHTFFPHWDSVLSSGKPVWILANDDCHDLKKEKFSIAWNVVNTQAMTENGVLSAIKLGSTIGVRRKPNFSDFDSLLQWSKSNTGQILKGVYTKGTEVAFHFDSTVTHIKLIGQDGKVRVAFTYQDSVAYTFKDHDTYIRAVAETDDVSVYLNPILRYNGKSEVENIALSQVEILPTLLLRMGILLMYSFLIVILFPDFFGQLFYGNKKQVFSYGRI